MTWAFCINVPPRLETAAARKGDLAGCYLTSPDTVAGIAPMPNKPTSAGAIHGSIPALITPFRNGIVDERGFQALVERQIAEGSHALVPCGTTGESPTLS